MHFDRWRLEGTVKKCKQTRSVVGFLVRSVVCRVSSVDGGQWTEAKSDVNKFATGIKIIGVTIHFP
jgi:hypothetical protein